MNATKLIKPAAPVTMPGSTVDQWMVGPVMFDTVAEVASVTLYAANEDGSRREDSAVSRNFGVAGAGFRQIFNSQQGQLVAEAFVALILSAATAVNRPETPQGTTIVDAA